MDPGFNYLGKLIIGMDPNKMAASYHVPETEIQIQVVKKRTRAVHGSLPYDRMTIQMIIKLGKYVIMVIKSFQPKSIISCTYIPRTIITGKQLDFKKQAHDNRNFTNHMIDRTQGDIYLGPTGNLQELYALLLLRTGRKINRSHFTELPRPPRVT